MKQNKQTAVNFLFQEFSTGIYCTYSKHDIDSILEEAEKLFKSQIKKAYNKGYQDGEIDSLDAKDGDVEFFEDAEQYYNENYGTE